jgi:hypothetical protein
MYEFCTDGSQEAQCYTLETINFSSEEKIFDILLDILKSELPGRIAQVKDCEDNYFFMSEEAIDILPSDKLTHLNVILNPIQDKPTYLDENKQLRTVTYNFEAILTVSNALKRCVTWELIRFKNVVEELIMAAELHIDGYNSVYIEPQGFQWFIPTPEDGVVRRSGAYRFSVTVTQMQNR